MTSQASNHQSSLRRPVWVVLLDFRSAPWLRLTAHARANQHDAKHPVRWIDSAAATFRSQAYGFAAKTLENALFVRNAAGLWHIGFDAMDQLEQLLNLAPTRPHQWHESKSEVDQEIAAFPEQAPNAAVGKLRR